MITEEMRDAEQEALRDLDAEDVRDPLCPACGQHGCDLIRQFGKSELGDFECGCGWRFRADRSGRVIREFGYAEVSA